MMAVLNANKDATLFHVVCRECLYSAPHPLRDPEAFQTADAHKPECPGEIPTTRTAAQQRHARKLLAGNY
ncbi:hypothetical protein DM794_06145 [Paenarthrobacter ureafaciens]|uniref:hypothetical protein n=1 Tax=Paenarthrobacter ureafaciens TaxID=37931 RepID=UPI0015BB71F0|nr:hypothetical protein [Paenarthrobacter ureafaciens]NWL26643.1 hypothetical protein [Paenarthrobacter ureafaciens]